MSVTIEAVRREIENAFADGYQVGEQDAVKDYPNLATSERRCDACVRRAIKALCEEAS